MDKGLGMVGVITEAPIEVDMEMAEAQAFFWWERSVWRCWWTLRWKWRGSRQEDVKMWEEV